MGAGSVRLRKPLTPRVLPLPRSLLIVRECVPRAKGKCTERAWTNSAVVAEQARTAYQDTGKSANLHNDLQAEARTAHILRMRPVKVSERVVFLGLEYLKLDVLSNDHECD